MFVLFVFFLFFFFACPPKPSTHLDVRVEQAVGRLLGVRGAHAGAGGGRGAAERAAPAPREGAQRGHERQGRPQHGVVPPLRGLERRHLGGGLVEAGGRSRQHVRQRPLQPRRHLHAAVVGQRAHVARRAARRSELGDVPPPSPGLAGELPVRRRRHALERQRRRPHLVGRAGHGRAAAARQQRRAEHGGRVGEHGGLRLGQLQRRQQRAERGLELHQRRVLGLELHVRAVHRGHGLAHLLDLRAVPVQPPLHRHELRVERVQGRPERRLRRRPVALLVGTTAPALARRPRQQPPHRRLLELEHVRRQRRLDFGAAVALLHEAEEGGADLGVVVHVKVD